MINLIKTTVLLTALTLLFLFLGFAAAGRQGMAVAFVFSCFMNAGAWWFSDRLVLSLFRAQRLEETDAPELYALAAGLAERASIPVPRLYLIPTLVPNAFATGRDPRHAAVALTRGLVEMLNREELEGVLAHEIAHLLNRDMLIGSVAAALAGAIAMVASMVRWAIFLGGQRRNRDSNPVVMLVMALLMPLAAGLIRTAVSRSREYEADRRGAFLCGNPLYLASALRRLDEGSRRYAFEEALPQTAHMFIVNPLQGNFFNRLFCTHPPLEERIARLEAMGR